jgi:hypothetical protein
VIDLDQVQFALLTSGTELTGKRFIGLGWFHCGNRGPGR